MGEHVCTFSFNTLTSPFQKNHCTFVFFQVSSDNPRGNKSKPSRKSSDFTNNKPFF